MVNTHVEKKRWGFIIFVLIFLALVSFMLAGFVSLMIGGDSIESATGNVALIPIKGIIASEEGEGIFETIASSADIVEFIEKADDNPNVIAIIFEIDSPGGSPVATDEIAAAVKKTNKTTVAWIRETGASGAYWIASASDHIVANRMSVTGSIGVLGSYLEFSGLLDMYNVSYQRLVSGKYKDVGSPFREMTAEEERIFQAKLGLIHDYFIEEVAKNRGLPEDKVREISTGMFYLGSEAKELGLVDELGGKDEAVRFIEEKHGVKAEISEYKKEKSFLQALSGLMSENSFFIGKGIGTALTDNAGKIIT